MDGQDTLKEVQVRLIENGGRTSQELGAGRIVGQIMVYLYLQKDSQSLDKIADALALSKASISIAVRQLEQFGVVRRVWMKGDRRKYYCSADNIGTAIQQGILSFMHQKIMLFGTELDNTLCMLDSISSDEKNERVDFLKKRIERASRLQRTVLKILGSPLVNFLTKHINKA